MSIRGYNFANLPIEPVRFLRIAISLVIDELFMDYQEMVEREEKATDVKATGKVAKSKRVELRHDDLWSYHFLPERYFHHYNSLFLKKMILCVSNVVSKLESPEDSVLASTAEELALYGLINRAETELDLEVFEEKIEIDEHWRTELDHCLYEDNDFEMLFMKRFDGIEDDEGSITQFGWANLSFKDWFKPFRFAYPVHPYLIEGEDFYDNTA